MTHVVKEQVRAAFSHFWWKKTVPKLTVKETPHNAAMMINAFSPKSGVSTCLSPHNAMVGRNLECKRHFGLPFGDCAQGS